MASSFVNLSSSFFSGCNVAANGNIYIIILYSYPINQGCPNLFEWGPDYIKWKYSGALPRPDFFFSEAPVGWILELQRIYRHHMKLEYPNIQSDAIFGYWHCSFLKYHLTSRYVNATASVSTHKSPLYIHDFFMIDFYDIPIQFEAKVKQFSTCRVKNGLFSPSLKLYFCILGSLNSVGFT